MWSSINKVHSNKPMRRETITTLGWITYCTKEKRNKNGEIIDWFYKVIIKAPSNILARIAM